MKQIYIVGVFIFILLFSGCSGNREASIPQYNTGMKKSQEWKEYNSYANEKKQPILDFAATTILYKSGEKGVTNYDNFLLNDPRITIQTKWHNCNPSDLFEFKFYLPDNRLADYQYFNPKINNTKWTIGKHMYLKNMPTRDIQGKWSVKVYVNGKYVITKYFNVGIENKKTQNYKKNKELIKVTFFPYWNDENSTWNHNKSAPRYTSLSSLRDNPNISIIPPYLVLKELGNPQFDYKRFKSQLIEDLKDADGTILSVMKKLQSDYIILGRVTSAWGMTGTQDTVFDTYIIDVKKKTIIDSIKTNVSLYRSDYNIGMRQKVKGMHPLRIKIYKELYKDLAAKINQLTTK
jgi:hypothetical protein